MKYRNPVIPGFYPDPSICRRGGDFYLVTSSFEYFPGVPVFTSRDLVTWRQIGHCLTRESQLPLDGIRASEGIFAPALRLARGKFFMVTTLFGGGGHFYVTADDPAGPWSEPTGVKGPWFDPDLFFDDDGKVYFSYMGFGEGIKQFEIDIRTGQPLSDERVVWTGFEDRYCEGPHLYKIGEWYYLLVAEGGTYRSHMIVAARSKAPSGPFEGCPHNPLLTHRCAIMHPIEHTGHGDLVQAPDGSWWIVFLGVRPYQQRYHLGRETFLAPVTWTEEQWPVINNGELICLEMEGPGPDVPPAALPAGRDDFDSPDLGLQWNFRRNPAPGSWSLTERPGHLRLQGNRNSLNDTGRLAFIGRRQQHFCCTARTHLECTPQAESEEAGLTVIMNEEHHYDLALTRRQGGLAIIVRKRIGDLVSEVAMRPVDTGQVVLGVEATVESYTFWAGPDEKTLQPVAEGKPRYLSVQVAGGFTGVYFGMYATGHGRDCQNPADFDWFEYRGRDV